MLPEAGDYIAAYGLDKGVERKKKEAVRNPSSFSQKLEKL